MRFPPCKVFAACRGVPCGPVATVTDGRRTDEPEKKGAACGGEGYGGAMQERRAGRPARKGRPGRARGRIGLAERRKPRRAKRGRKGAGRMARRRRGERNRELGRRGEDAAARFLDRRGYDIVERNWTCAAGEADIIARDGDGARVRGGEDAGRAADEAACRPRRWTRPSASRYERIAALFLRGLRRGGRAGALRRGVHRGGAARPRDHPPPHRRLLGGVSGVFGQLRRAGRDAARAWRPCRLTWRWWWAAGMPGVLHRRACPTPPCRRRASACAPPCARAGFSMPDERGGGEPGARRPAQDGVGVRPAHRGGPAARPRGRWTRALARGRAHRGRAVAGGRRAARWTGLLAYALCARGLGCTLVCADAPAAPRGHRRPRAARRAHDRRLPLGGVPRPRPARRPSQCAGRARTSATWPASDMAKRAPAGGRRRRATACS